LQEDDLQRGDCGESICKEPGSCDCIGATLNYAIEVESLFEKSSSLVFRVGAAQDKAIIEGAGGATGRGGARCTKWLIGWLQRPAWIELWRKMVAIIPGFLRNEGPDELPAQNGVSAQSDKISDGETAIQAESGRLALLGGCLMALGGTMIGFDLTSDEIQSAACELFGTVRDRMKRIRWARSY
jgi:hypothetical protein